MTRSPYSTSPATSTVTRPLSYMKEMGMGNDKYVLIDLDNGGKRITAEEAAKDLKPFVK